MELLKISACFLLGLISAKTQDESTHENGREMHEGVSEKKPCCDMVPPEGLNTTGIFDGRWFITKVYYDLIQKKPEVANVCVMIDFTNQEMEEVNFMLIYQGVSKNISGVINGKNNGEIKVTMNSLSSNPYQLIAMRFLVIESEGENLAFYACGGLNGIFLHVGFICSRTKTADPVFTNNVDPKLKSLDFILEGMSITNLNCSN